MFVRKKNDEKMLQEAGWQSSECEAQKKNTGLTWGEKNITTMRGSKTHCLTFKESMILRI